MKTFKNSSQLFKQSCALLIKMHELNTIAAKKVYKPLETNWRENVIKTIHGITSRPLIIYGTFLAKKACAAEDVLPRKFAQKQYLLRYLPL